MTNNTRTKVSRGSLESENIMEVETERIEMKLNTENSIASGLLIQRLTELYEDPIAASIRETVSNALDATAEGFSGNQAEVKVTLPTSLQPLFSVEDNGVGMSYEDLKNIYSKYGASTKMDNFDQIGAYGLGAKAPLAYGTEFTVTSTKDGVTTTIIVVREDLTNYIKIVDSKKTDNPSGTKVSIPVSRNDIDKFIGITNNNYKSTVMERDDVKFIIDGEEVKNEEYVLLNESILLLDGEEKVYGRIWSKGGSSLESSLFNKSQRILNLTGRIEYVIGGWGYKNGRWVYTDPLYVVELKPGIVSFNSSRDHILENERYEELEKLVYNYLTSEECFEDTLDCINSSSIEDFKEILSNVFSQNSRVGISKDLSEVTIGNDTYPSVFMTHKETGYNINSLFKSIPKVNKRTVSFEYSWMTTWGDKTRSFSMRNTLNQSELISILDRVMLAEDNEYPLESESFKSIIYKAFTSNKNEREDSIEKVLFLTGLEDDKDYLKVRRARRRILDMYSEEDMFKHGNILVVFTENTKQEVELMVKDSKIDNALIKDFSEISEALKKKKVARAKVTKVEPFSLFVSKLEEGFLNRAELEDIQKSKKAGNKILIISKAHSGINYSDLKMLENDFKEKEGLGYLEEIDTYLVRGKQRKVDLEALVELTPNIYLIKNYSRSIGDSAYVKEYYESKEELSPLFLMSDDPERRVKALKAVLNKQFSRFYYEKGEWSILSDNMNESIQYLNDLLSPFTQIKIDKVNSKNNSLALKINSLSNDLNYSKLSSSVSSIRNEDLFKELKDEDFRLLEDISTVLSFNRYSKKNRISYSDENGNYTNPAKDRKEINSKAILNLDYLDSLTLKEAFNDSIKSKEDSLFKILRRQCLEIMEALEETVKRINEFEF